jgi:hypothetical protein
VHAAAGAEPLRQAQLGYTAKDRRGVHKAQRQSDRGNSRTATERDVSNTMPIHRSRHPYLSRIDEVTSTRIRLFKGRVR